MEKIFALALLLLFVQSTALYAADKDIALPKPGIYQYLSDDRRNNL